MNSTNIKVISEEVQRLKDKVHSIDVEVPDPSQATDGQILSVDDGKYVISDPDTVLPDKTGSATGDVLGLVGEAKTPGWITPYNPQDYSTTEQDTGVKWIDGNEVYCRVVSGSFPEITAAVNVNAGTIATNLNIISINKVIKTSDLSISDYLVHQYSKSSGVITILSVPVSYSEGTYIIIVYYTKPTENREPDETETQSTKKKTTKKGE